MKWSWRKSDLTKGQEQTVLGWDFGISAVELKLQKKTMMEFFPKEIILSAVRQIREGTLGWPNTGYNVGGTARSSAVTRGHFRSSPFPSSRWQHRRLVALGSPYLAFSFPGRRNFTLLRYHQFIYRRDVRLRPTGNARRSRDKSCGGRGVDDDEIRFHDTFLKFDKRRVQSFGSRNCDVW